MDLQSILLVLTAVVLGIFMIRLLRTPLRLVLDWWLTLAVVAAIVAGAWRLTPGNAGWFAFTALCGLIFAPLRLDRAAQRLSRAGDDSRAMLFARIAALLHPFGAIGSRPATLDALSHIRATGEVDDATLAKLGAGEDPIIGEWYRILALHAAADHAGVRAALAIPARRVRMLQHGLGAIFVRTVAMTGSRAEILEALDEAERHDLTLDDPERRAVLALEACAALGDVEGVRELAVGLAGRLPQGSIERALASAQIEHGERAAARETINKALATPLDPAVRRSFERLRGRVHRDREPANEVVERRALKILERLRREAKASQALAPLADGSVYNAWTTWALAAGIVGWFAVIASHGKTTDPENLRRMGGLVLPIEDAHGALGIFTSTFVHYGVVHLLFNLYALLTFGRFVESFYGRPRMLAIWIAATLTSGIGVAATSTGGILVGASGAIFGLGGALVAGVALRPDLRKSQRGREELKSFAMIAVLQFVFDRVVPGVSGTAHVCGLLGGLLAGAVFLPRRAAR